MRLLQTGGAGIYLISSDLENVAVRNNLVAFGWGEWMAEGWSEGWVGQITLAEEIIGSRVTVSNNITFGPDKCSQTYPDCVHLIDIDQDPLFQNRLNNDLP